MYKKIVAYTDYNGIDREQTCYFNMTKTECYKLTFGEGIDLQEKLEELIRRKDAKSLMSFFDEFLRKAYGEKSDDGMHFMKSDEISNKFEASPAYDALYYQLVTDAEFAAEFVQGCLPTELAAEIDKAEVLKFTNNGQKPVFKDHMPKQTKTDQSL